MDNNAFDLAKHLADNNIGPLDSFCTDGVDLSGKPQPTNVRVQLNSGVVIKCDVRYREVNPVDGDRIFVVVAEIDWENYTPKVILVEDMPNDVEFRFRIPGMSDAEAQRLWAGCNLHYDRLIGVK